MITQVAIRYQGKVYSLPAPNRHHHILRMIFEETGEPMEENEQGFLDEEGNFLNRIEALAHALAHNQVLDPDNIRAGRLFSEDLW